MNVTLIRVRLRLDTPGGVSAPEAATDSCDLPLARDADGHPRVPATSLAGALRAHLKRQKLDVDRIMGTVCRAATEPAGQPAGPTVDQRTSTATRTRAQEKTMAVASVLAVLGSRVELAGQEERATRAAIDRGRGATRRHELFTAEALAAGSYVHMFLRLETAGDHHALREQLLAALASWAPVIGRGGSIGMGRTTVAGLWYGHLDLRDPDDLLAWLTFGGEALFGEHARQEYPVRPAASTPAEPWLAVPLRIRDGLFVANEKPSPAQARGGTIAEVFRRSGQPVVPGATWKGVLRSRCEFILRSVGVDACANQECRHCPACRLFGFGGGDSTGDAVGARGRLAFLDSPVVDAVVGTRRHVAIDRVTGGARPGLLFAHQVLVAGTVTLKIHPLGDVPGWARGLLLWAVRDIHDGYVGIGGSTTRGLGTLKLVDPELVTSLTSRQEMRSALAALRSPSGSGVASPGPEPQVPVPSEAS